MDIIKVSFQESVSPPELVQLVAASSAHEFSDPQTDTFNMQWP